MSFHPLQALEHGGPDALGVPRWDFSANANACGVAPHAWTLIAEADRARYPDPGYTALRALLAEQHGVVPERIVLAASGSEFIRRVSVAVTLGRPDDARVRVPAQAYAEYAAAARALQLPCDTQAANALPVLAWWATPDSPAGVAVEVPCDAVSTHGVVDLAYAPLQLEGAPCEPPAWTWQLWSPNKALGLTGVRGAYAVAPEAALRRGHPDAVLLERLQVLAPSWPLGAEGVALLTAWAGPETGAWLVHTRATLRAWKARQIAMLEALGWAIEPGVANFMLAHWRLEGEDAELRRKHILAALRDEGVKLRDATDLGRPGHLRLSVQAPAAQDALAEAWLRVRLLLAQRAAVQVPEMAPPSAPKEPDEPVSGSPVASAGSESPQSELPFEPIPEVTAASAPQERTGSRAELAGDLDEANSPVAAQAVEAGPSIDTGPASHAGDTPLAEAAMPAVEGAEPEAPRSRSGRGRSRARRATPKAEAAAESVQASDLLDAQAQSMAELTEPSKDAPEAPASDAASEAAEPPARAPKQARAAPRKRKPASKAGPQDGAAALEEMAHPPGPKPAPGRAVKPPKAHADAVVPAVVDGDTPAPADAAATVGADPGVEPAAAAPAPARKAPRRRRKPAAAVEG